MRFIFRQFGFTLIELMVIVVIVGTIAAFAIPNYRKAVEKGYERAALTNLTLIYSKQEAIKARTGNYWPGDGRGNVGMPTLATEMELNIAAGAINYVCVTSTGRYICYAIRVGGPTNWQLYVDSRIVAGTGGTMPCCDTGYAACPSISNCTGGYIF
jgi:prepilin-type N-terminal cleavage/methylation domain-containing protein